MLSPAELPTRQRAHSQCLDVRVLTLQPLKFKGNLSDGFIGENSGSRWPWHSSWAPRVLTYRKLHVWPGRAVGIGRFAAALAWLTCASHVFNRSKAWAGARLAWERGSVLVFLPGECQPTAGMAAPGEVSSLSP